MGLIDDARATAAARPERRIDYARMQRVFPSQKAALTRAVKTKDPEKVAAACVKAMNEWDEIGAWPDDWARWQRALDDVLPWNQRVDLHDLRGLMSDMIEPHACDECGTVYDEASGEGYCGLCPSCADAGVEPHA